MRSGLFCVSQYLLLGIRDDEEWVVLCKSLTVGGSGLLCVSHLLLASFPGLSPFYRLQYEK